MWSANTLFPSLSVYLFYGSLLLYDIGSMIPESKLTRPLFHEDLPVLGNSTPSKDLEVRSSLVEVVFEIRVSLPMGLMLQVDPVPL